MSMREREGLIRRIRQIRRTAAASRPPASAAAAPAAPESVDPPASPAQRLEARVAHLEQLVEGLQDSVHRESERHAKLIGEIQEQIHPAAMNAALSRDARERGL